MAQRGKKVKASGKMPDLCDYANMDYNPFIPTQETYEKLNSEYAMETIDHRNRMAKWKAREDARAALAASLGVTFSPKLTPVDEILKDLE